MYTKEQKERTLKEFERLAFDCGFDDIIEVVDRKTPDRTED